MKRLLMLTLLTMLLLCAAAHADTLTVAADGTADYPSLTAALAAADVGDEIILAAGVYDQSRETFPILADKRVAIRAADGAEVTLSAPKMQPTMKLMADGIRVENVRVDFLRSGFWIMADDITVTGCTFTLTDEIWRTSSCGMWIAGARRFTMTDCAFAGCSAALAGPPLSESSNGLPVLTGMFEVGEDKAFFTSHQIENCTVNGKPLMYVVGLRDTTYTADCGQLLAVDCHNVTFTDIHTDFTSIGIELGYCTNCTLQNSSADDAGIFGIYIAKCEDCLITACRADRSAHGIDLRAIYQCVVENCHTTDSDQGVFFSFAFGSLVTGCEIRGSGKGFFAAAGDENHVDNTLLEGCDLGIHIQTENDFTITNSLFHKSVNTGARVTLSDGFHCIGCEFEDNWVAAMINYSQDVHLQGNSFRDTRNCALYMKELTGVRQIGNRFTEADAALIQIYDCPDRLIWDDGAEADNAGGLSAN